MPYLIVCLNYHNEWENPGRFASPVCSTHFGDVDNFALRHLHLPKRFFCFSIRTRKCYTEEDLGNPAFPLIQTTRMESTTRILPCDKLWGINSAYKIIHHVETLESIISDEFERRTFLNHWNIFPVPSFWQIGRFRRCLCNLTTRQPPCSWYHLHLVIVFHRF